MGPDAARDPVLNPTSSERLMQSVTANPSPADPWNVCGRNFEDGLTVYRRSNSLFAKMALDAARFMRPGTCDSPSWQRLCRYAVYVDADLLVATRINTLADGAGHTF